MAGTAGLHLYQTGIYLWESRVDFYMEKGAEKYLFEVKGCTLEIDGVGYFPDAPTERGVKHLRELTQAALSITLRLPSSFEELPLLSEFS